MSCIHLPAVSPLFIYACSSLDKHSPASLWVRVIFYLALHPYCVVRVNVYLILGLIEHLAMILQCCFDMMVQPVLIHIIRVQALQGSVQFDIGIVAVCFPFWHHLRSYQDGCQLGTVHTHDNFTVLPYWETRPQTIWLDFLPSHIILLLS